MQSNLKIIIMLSFTYLFNYGTLNIFKVQGNCVLYNRPTELDNYILTDKNLSDVKLMTNDEVFRCILPFGLYELIRKYYND